MLDLFLEDFNVFGESTGSDDFDMLAEALSSPIVSDSPSEITYCHNIDFDDL